LLFITGLSERFSPLVSSFLADLSKAVAVINPSIAPTTRVIIKRTILEIFKGQKKNHTSIGSVLFETKIVKRIRSTSNIMIFVFIKTSELIIEKIF